MTLARLGDENIRRFGEYDALAFAGRRLTNVDQHRAGCRVAHALRRLGVEPGDRVLVMLPNCPEVIQSYGTKHVRFASALPKSPVGKIVRRELRGPA